MSEELLRETVFELPGGLVLDEDRRMRAVELRPLTGREEAWLAQHPDAPAAVAVTAVLGGCMVNAEGAATGRELARKLLAGDRDFLILQLRRLTLGDRVQAVIDCPACGERIDAAFDAGQVPVEKVPQQVPFYTAEAGSRAVRFRLPNGADQEAVSGLGLEEAADRLLDRCLLDGSLDGAEKSEVIREMERRAPRIDLELDMRCPDCGHEFLTPFDTTSFFFQEVRLKGDRLLREVHTIALYYHWSEAEILSLTRPRRRAYLELLSDSVRER